MIFNYFCIVCGEPIKTQSHDECTCSRVCQLVRNRIVGTGDIIDLTMSEKELAQERLAHVLNSEKGVKQTIR